jgi:hypothetical protein
MKLGLFLVCFLPLLSLAQGFQPGFLVTAQGDTVRGLLKHPFGSPYGVRFKDENNIKKNYSQKDVVSYFIDQDGLYRSVWFMKDSMPHMMKVVVDDYLSYYEVQLGQTTENYFHILQKKDSPTQYWYSSEWFAGFKKGVADYLKDDSLLSVKLKNGEYGRKDIITIVREYNRFHNTGG